MDAVSCMSYILAKNAGKSAKQALQCRLKAEWEGLEDCGRHVEKGRSWKALEAQYEILEGCGVYLEGFRKALWRFSGAFWKALWDLRPLARRAGGD